ncbi:MAG: ribosome small subunit-dependent GTPase A [Clostridiales bacterium]|nr:ribosome small subunit-dependent GTPase A [Clostridiales bacterium]
MNKTGRVIRVLSDRFVVATALGEEITVKARKRHKKDGLLAGDSVKLDFLGGEYVLSEVLPRKNALIRPPVANLDCLIITLAPLPLPDFLTIDKMLINAHRIGLETVLCINKSDIAPQGFAEEIMRQYANVADEIVSVCAANGDTDALKPLLRGKFSCLAGQSAVGKTSLINEICGKNRQVGDLSEKSGRGKNTTTGVELIPLGENGFLADSPGFGALDLFEITYSELMLYYDEYVRFAHGCRFSTCTHTEEPNCEVRSAVERGELNAERYERYKLLYTELKTKSQNRKSWRYANEYK